jgi:hypothetical protein
MDISYAELWRRRWRLIVKLTRMSGRILSVLLLSALLLLLILILVLAPLIAFENWRAHRAWDRFVADTAATGDDISPESVIPPPVPDEENFAAIPLFQELFQFATNDIGKRHWESGRLERLDPYPDYGEFLWHPADSFGDSLWYPLWNANWKNGRATDLALWQPAFRSDTNFPSTVVPGTPGSDMLLALSKFEPELALLREAASRPQARFPVGYGDASALLRHLSPIRKCTLIFQLKAVAELSENETVAAASDTEHALRVADSPRLEPFYISQMVRSESLETAMQPLWQGIVRSQWSDDQLARFDLLLSRADFLTDLQRVLRGMRNLVLLPEMDLAWNNPSQYVKEMREAPEDWTWRLLYIFPDAYFIQNKESYGRMIQRVLIATDIKARRVDVAAIEALRNEISSLEEMPWWRVPYLSLALWNADNVPEWAQKFAHTQTRIDLARVAIALERHRMRHGAFPETLEGLDAAVVPAGGLPHDLVTGDPLRYRRTDNGRFDLYAVGWNGTDDGGVTAWHNEARTGPDRAQGDWVWPQPVE